MEARSAQRWCVWLSFCVVAGCVLILILSWTPPVQTMPEYILLATAPLGFATVLSAMWMTRGHAFRFAHLPLWAKGLWAALLLSNMAAGGHSYTFGSGRSELVAFAPWWAYFGVWFSYTAVMFTWAALRHPAEQREPEEQGARQG